MARVACSIAGGCGRRDCATATVMTDNTASAATTPNALRIMATLYRRVRVHGGPTFVCTPDLYSRFTADLKVRIHRTGGPIHGGPEDPHYRLEHLVPGVEERCVQRLHSHKAPGPGRTVARGNDRGKPQKRRKEDRRESARGEEPAGRERRQDIDQD